MSPAPRIDLLALDALTSARDIEALISSLRIRLASDASLRLGVVVPPVFAKLAVEALRGSGIRVASVVGYPLGLAKSTIKAIEATSLAKDGVNAIELTPLATNVLAGLADGHFAALHLELLEVVRGVKAARPHTAVHVRIDLDVIRPNRGAAATLETVIVRGACDGVVFETRFAERSREALASWPTSTSLECKLVAHGFEPDALTQQMFAALGRPVSGETN